MGYKKVYAVIGGMQVLKSSESRHQCVAFINSFPRDFRKSLHIVCINLPYQNKKRYRFISKNDDV